MERPTSDVVVDRCKLDGAANMQPVNLLRLAMKMVQNLPMYSLSIVHHALCLSSTLRKFHRAGVDTLAVSQVVGRMVESE